jgi:alpha-tubulin suppressor-like RCC1 family protein
MKRKLIIGLATIFFIGIISATPFILFVNPTPYDGERITASEFSLNATIGNMSDLLDFTFNWDGTNISLYNEDLILMLNLNNNSAIGENSTHVVDVSRWGHNGTVVSASLTNEGKYGKGFSFDADDEYINLSDHEDFRGNEFTISLWHNKTGINIKQVSSFGYSSCLILDTGTVYCVGDNTYGQMGDETTDQNSIFEEVSGGHEFESLCLEDYSNSLHLCGLLANGTGFCWGDNTNGKLGDGTTTQRETPTLISGGYNFSNLYCGRYNTCGLLQNGSALCWGGNSYGQLGLGGTNTTQMITPTYVSGGNIFNSLSTGDSEQCGLLHNGSALCWGRNDHGQIGNGSVDVLATIPSFVSGNHNFSFISLGNEKVCGILQNKSALCWGNQASGGSLECLGGLGTNDCLEYNVPTPVYGGFSFSYFEPNYWGYCGILENGSSVCWGGNYYGEIGDNTIGPKIKPTFTQGNYNFSKISSGKENSFGILTNGDLISWGNTRYKVLGKGDISDSFLLPILFNHGNISESSYSSVYLGYGFACGLLSNKSVACWGDNTYGQLGDNTTIQRGSPKLISGGFSFNSISIKNDHVCGVLVNGSGACWGRNTYGQLGDNTTIQRNISRIIFGYNNFSYISAGKDVSCGLLRNGSALCWGRNNRGHVGDNSTTQRNYPVYVNGSYNFSIIGVGSAFSCGLLQNESALCWGRNNFGQLGNPSSITQSTIPLYVSKGYTFSTLEPGAVHTCGILNNGSALCWGTGIGGRLGLGGTNETNMFSPTYVSGGHNFTSVSLSTSNTCGVLINGSGLCWGWNPYGQVGDGTISDRYSPTIVQIDNLFSSINIGGWFSFGFLTDGRIVSWGYNGNLEQAFLNFNSNIPTKGIYKGRLIGKSVNSFDIASTFEGNSKIIVNNGFRDLDLNSGWNNIILSYNGTTANIYLDGELSNSFDPPGFSYLNDTTALLLGDDIRGQIDEILMWNRTLSATEIEQVYRSSLKKNNHTAWEFYSAQTLSTDKSYSYYLFAMNPLGSFKLLRTIVKYTVQEEESSGGGVYVEPTYRVTEAKLQEGHTRTLKQGSKIKLEFSTGSEILHIVNVKDNIVIVKVKDIEYEVENGSVKKIDIDSDGFYDLELGVEKISESGGSGRLTFKEIHEGVISSGQEEVKEEAREENGAVGEEEGDRNPINERNRWWVYTLLGVGGIIVLGIVFLIIKKHIWVKKRSKPVPTQLNGLKRKKRRGKSNHKKTVEKFKS